MLLTILLFLAVVLLLVSAGIALRFFYIKAKNDTKGSIRAVVDEVNKSTMYAYNYEKQQGEYIKNLDHNVFLVDKHLKTLQNQVSSLNVNAATKEDLRKMRSNEFGNVTVGDINIGSTNVGNTTFLNLKSKTEGPIGLQADVVNVNSMISLRGDMIITDGAFIKKTGSGPIIETTDPVTNERSGIGKYPGSHTRVYSTNAISLAKINGNGSFQDLLRADPNAINISKPLCLNDSICLVADGPALHVCPAYNPTISNPDCKQIV